MGRRKNELIAAKYVCRKCLVPLFCIVGTKKTRCLNCDNDNCPDDICYIDGGNEFPCCVVRESMQKIRELVSN